ncbi:alpha/beta hydrolase fold domain-containing protein [Butyricicoccus sp.]|uniref:alpha/beta hydrolase fold domain-containing protein n=1 Tax=Butyricicoccus sp. TaxID=2049021 RepID=UPI003AAD0135
MKRIKTLLLIVMISLAVFAAGFAFVSVHVYHRSIGASLMELRLQSKNSTRVFETAQNAQKYMQRRAKSEDKWYELPKDVSFESTMIVFHYRNIKLLAFVPESEKKHIVLYLHGGAYVSQISKNQLRFCDRLAQQSDSVVLAPIYPLAPNHRFSETYLVLEHLYPDIRGYTDLPLTILGDSAGGGLAAGFCEYLGVWGWEQPEHLILICPWLDATLSNPDIKRYAKHDPTLSPKGLRRMGKAWAGPYTNAKDYRISPMFGELSYFRDVTLFTGTRELLHPDVVKFSELLQGAGAETTLHVGNGLNHNYPLYDIPEAGGAMRQICEAIAR